MMADKEYDFAAVLVFFVENGKIVLARKKRKNGEGRYNGYGGEIEQQDLAFEQIGISAEKAAVVREVRRETGGAIVLLSNLQKVAEAYFANVKDDGGEYLCKVTIFFAPMPIGRLKESQEMGPPEVFNFHNVPFYEMMAADRYFVPELLKGRKLIVRAKMKNGQRELVGPVEIVDAIFF